MYKELLISFLACLCIGAAINGWNAATPTPAPTATETGSAITPDTNADGTANSSGDGTAEGTVEGSNEKPLESSDATFEQDVLQSEVPVLVDFTASWCQPCQNMVPVVNQLAKDYEGRVKIVKVDTDKNPALRDKYRISKLPTFMFFRSGQSIASQSGQVPQELLVGVIDRQLIK